jgi:hypothetical protein
MILSVANPSLQLFNLVFCARAIGWENYDLLEKLISNMEKMLKQKGETKNEG